MGLNVYGIIAAQSPDNAGETILIDGIDTTHFRIVKDEHPLQDNFFHSIGAMKNFKKIYSEDDCEDHKQLRCWRYAQVPLLYGEGELADDADHPNAKSAAAMMKFTQREDIPLKVGWSIDGGIAERQLPDGTPTEDKEMGKILAQTVALAGSLTVNPCNPKCLAFIDNDLTKSQISKVKPPENYVELLQKSQSRSSVIETISKKDILLLLSLDKLKKSLGDYFSAFTDMRCKSCGNPVRFFKSTSSFPNKCGKCDEAFSMLDIWGAINK